MALGDLDADLRPVLGDFEVVDFLAGLGEFVGLIELNRSLACLLAKRLWRCMFINVLKSFRSSRITGCCPGWFLLTLSGVMVLAERTVVNFEDLVVVVVPLEVEPGVLLQLDLDPQELLSNSLLIFGSQRRGTEGGGDGLGACLLGDEVRVKTSVG